MNDKIELLLEAERRGILPDDKRALLNEARNRGLVPKNNAPVLPEMALMAAHPKMALASAHGPKPVDERLRLLSSIYRPLLEGGGGAAGGIIGAGAGSLTGPGAALTGMAGGALGYAGGRQLANLMDEWFGIRQPPNLKELAVETGKNLATGAALEAGGQAIAPVFVGAFRGGKWVFNKLTGSAARMLTTQGAKRAAGEILVANTSSGQIFAQNAKEAAEIEKSIPGLKFTKAQKTGDPNLIKLERTQVRKMGNAAEQSVERTAANNEALRSYYEKNFGSENNIDDLYTGLKNVKTKSQQGAETAQKAAQTKTEALPIKKPQDTGQKIVSTLKAGKESAKKESKKLYKKVPKSVTISVDTMLDEFKSIEKPMSKFENTENVPPILKRVIKSLDSKNIKTGEQFRSWTPYKIKSAALKTENGKIYTGQTHAEAFEKIPSGESAKVSTGFVTKEGNFVTNEQAVKMARQGMGNNTMSLKDAQGLASELKAQLRDAQSSANPNERLISRLRQAVSAVEDAIKGGERGSAELKAAGRFYREDYIGKFKQGTVGDILRKGPRGEETRIPLAQIPGKIWNSHNLSAADDFIKAAGEKAPNLMRDHAAYDLMQNATDVNGKIVSSKFNNWFIKNRDLLKRFGIEIDFKNVGMAQKAADAAAKNADSFEKTIASKILNSDPERAIAVAFTQNKTGVAAKQLVDMIGNNKPAMAGLQKSFADHIMTEIQTTAKDVAGNPVVSNAAFSRLMKKYEPAIKIIYKDSPQKIKALNTMRRAYEIATRTTRSPIGGGSDTAENVLTELGKMNILWRPAVIAKGIFKVFSKYSDRQIDDLVTRALFDPDYAEVLVDASVGKINPKELNILLEGKIIKLDEFRKTKLSRVASGTAATFVSKKRNKK